MATKVVQAVLELCPHAAPVTVRSALRPGRAHRSWLVDSALGPMVVKVGLGEPKPMVLARLAEHRRAWKCGAPVPGVLEMASHTHELGARLVALLEYLPGMDAEAALPRLGSPEIGRVFQSAGQAVATLHATGAPGFGDPRTGLGSGPPRWADYVVRRIELLCEELFQAGVGPDDFINSAFDLVMTLAEEVSLVVAPGLVHCDVYLPNLLVGTDNGVSLLDLEHLRWVDPAIDFVKPAMWMFEGQPNWADAFIDGYMSTAGRMARCRERLAVATGLELLTGLGYWAKVGDRAMGADYAARLGRWVGSDGRDHGWPGQLPE